MIKDIIAHGYGPSAVKFIVTRGYMSIPVTGTATAGWGMQAPMIVTGPPRVNASGAAPNPRVV